MYLVVFVFALLDYVIVWRFKFKFQQQGKEDD